MNLFKTKTTSPFEVDNKKQPEVIIKGKTTDELIDEIHESFYTEVDKLLAEAKILKPVDTDKGDLIKKTERLSKLGFGKTKEVQAGTREISRLDTIKASNERKAELVETINYFTVKYPMYKFITEQSVKFICEKYGLVYSTVNRYIGTVPDKNLDDIEKFQINDDDKCYLQIQSYYNHFSRPGNQTIEINKQMWDKGNKDNKQHHISPVTGNPVNYIYSVSPLEIAAPLSDFDIKKSEVKDFKLSDKVEIPDPVVLQPVFYNNTKHYLIITAWGKESTDELVINHNMN